jgi:hypothetical protein
MADDIRCTIMPGLSLDDWWVLEKERDKNVYDLLTRGWSGRITNADIEGTSEEWKAIAEGIEQKSARISFKRVAMHTNDDDTIAIWSPRNSTYHAELTADAAAHLAREIRKKLAEGA